MRNIKVEPRFKRDVKNCEKKHWDMLALKKAIDCLMAGNSIELSFFFKDHPLVGALEGKRSLHINNASQPKKDTWVLLYQIVDEEIILLRTGTHNEVYGK